MQRLFGLHDDDPTAVANPAATSSSLAGITGLGGVTATSYFARLARESVAPEEAVEAATKVWQSGGPSPRRDVSSGVGGSAFAKGLNLRQKEALAGLHQIAQGLSSSHLKPAFQTLACILLNL